MKTIGTVAEIFGFSVLAAAGVFSAYIRIANIDMTSTRLFVEYWFVWIPLIPVVIIGYKLVEWGNRLKNGK